MKAITLWQPWAQLVALKLKEFETRSWMTRWRGRLAIHAAAEFPLSARRLCWQEPFSSALLGNEDDLPTGCVVAICDLAAVYRTAREPGSLLEVLPDISARERAFGNYAPGRFAWNLQNVWALEEPIPAKGKQGLWNWGPAPGFNDNDTTMKKKTPKNDQYRQGDVLIERVPSLPKCAGAIAPENGRVILAHGEVTGHAHEIEKPKLASLHEVREAMLALGDLGDASTMTQMALAIAEDTAVVHDEHSRIPLKKGSYLVRRQREYSPEEIRNVAD